MSEQCKCDDVGLLQNVILLHLDLLIVKILLPVPVALKYQHFLNYP